MLNHDVLRHSLPRSTTVKLLTTEDQVIAAGRAIGVVLKTMKYSRHEPDQWETKYLVAALADLQDGLPLAAIRELDHALEAHSERSLADNRSGSNVPVDTLIQKLDSIFRLPA